MKTDGIHTIGQRNHLTWQCRRGMRELDEMLNTFLEKRYKSLGQKELEQLNVLLEYHDTVLLEVLMGRQAAPDTEVANLVQEIRNTTAP
jgi:antitoxin CptB